MLQDVCGVFARVAPATSLEIGVGFGKYGCLFREIADARFGRVQERDWKCQLYGVEYFAGYSNPAWGCYNQVVIGNALDIDDSSIYDFVFCGDVLEHIEKSQALELIERLKKVANKCLVIVVPLGASPQGAMFGNDKEQHISEWSVTDFPGFKNVLKENKGMFVYETIG